jgi:hypothetical protein
VEEDPVSQDALKALARDLAADPSLSTEDQQAILAQAQRILEVVGTLDELPLAGVEPAPVYTVMSRDQL